MKFPWQKRGKTAPKLPEGPKPTLSEEEATELHNGWLNHEMQDCGLMKCMDCDVFINEDELGEHKGHTIADSTGKIITQQVLKRMKGG